MTFETHIRGLEKEEEVNKQRDKERERRVFRKNRDRFQVRGVSGSSLSVTAYEGTSGKRVVPVSD